jgi:segregation and condensation protein A
MVGEWDAVLGHLLFHKSLIDEDSDGRKIDDYMAMVRNLETGMTVIASDPIEKAISIAFQLVEEHGFNPWDIDLSEFTKMYMKRIRNEPEVNFVIAGRLVLMAWSILKKQSEEVLHMAEPPAPAEPMEWDPGIYVMPEDIDYRETVMGGDAFDEARQEIKLQETLKKLRENQKPMENKSIEDKVHRENMQEDIAMTWERICHFGTEPIPLTALHTGDPWDRIAIFTSILFLAKHKRVRLEQKSLPYGEIYISNIELRRMNELNSQASMQFDALPMIAPAAADLMAAAPPQGMAQGVTASVSVQMAQGQQSNYGVSDIGRA